MTIDECLETAALVADWEPPPGLIYRLVIEPSRGRVVALLETCCTRHGATVQGPGTRDVARRKLDEFARYVLAHKEAKHKGMTHSAGSDDPDDFEEQLNLAANRFLDGLEIVKGRR